MTFEQWWKEYCVKHHYDIGSPFENALREVANDTYNKWYQSGVKDGYHMSIEDGLKLLNETI